MGPEGSYSSHIIEGISIVRDDFPTLQPHVASILADIEAGKNNSEIARKYFPDNWENARRTISNLRSKQPAIKAKYAAERIIAQQEYEAERIIAREAYEDQVKAEVAAVKKYKDFRERNEEVYKLAIAVAAKAIQKENLNAAAMALAQANAATAQIKPLVQPESDQGAPKESGFMKCYMAQADELYATESQKNRKASIRMEASQPEAKADPVLVDSQQSG